MVALSYAPIILSLLIVKSGGLIKAKFYGDRSSMEFNRISSSSSDVYRTHSQVALGMINADIATGDSTSSVYLQLNKKLQKNDAVEKSEKGEEKEKGNEEGTEEGKEEEKDEKLKDHITIDECIRLSDKTVIFASATANSNLPAFSLYAFGKDYTNMEGYSMIRVRSSLSRLV